MLVIFGLSFILALIAIVQDSTCGGKYFSGTFTRFTCGMTPIRIRNGRITIC